MCVCVGGGGGVRAYVHCIRGLGVRARVLVHALRIVFTNRILRFVNTLIYYYYWLGKLFACWECQGD